MTHAQQRRMQVRINRRRVQTLIRREVDQLAADRQAEAKVAAELAYLAELESHYFNVLRPAGLPMPTKLAEAGFDDFLAHVELEVDLVGAW